MSAEHSDRRNHHRQPRPDFGHWCGTAYVLGTVEACDECGICDAQYGSNPDLCYQPRGHAGTHSNRYGTTWATDGGAA